MPRIDPIQLLKCLSVLLSSKGGILSNEEVHRLASLMTKFSKKLVSKCIYIQILKCTETELLGSFMGSGGWRLAHMWLTESIVAKNWPLVRELLELLLLCPVDIDLLKTNNCPKLVKELSKDGSQAAIRSLAAKLVEQWLKTVKGESVSPVTEADFAQIIAEGSHQSELEKITKEEIVDIKEEIELKDIESEKNAFAPLKVEVKEETEDKEKESDTLPILKISLKDGKQVISKIEENNQVKQENHHTEKDKHSKSKSRSDDNKNLKSKHSSSSKHISRSHSSKSSSEKNKKDSKTSNSNSSSSKDKNSHKKHSSSDKEKEKKIDKSHSSLHGSKEDKSKSSHRSHKQKDDKDKRKSSKDNTTSGTEITIKEKPKMALSSPISKLMKIPKLSDTKRETPSISIETRNPNDPNRPKTVKTFNSKFRSHGLEEEAKPPPPRGSVKKSTPVLAAILPMPKRTSPPHNLEQPPEKKPKTVEIDKPGSIKLIPAKPKPCLLLESDMFMDALNASATNKKEPKKRKRRISGSKDGNPSSDTSPPTTPTMPSPNSVIQENKAAPLRFYKDTLETEEEKDMSPENTPEDAAKSELPEDLEKKEDELDIEPHIRISSNGLRGVLCYHKKKGPKKSIRWKSDAELEQIQYFELDETERVNVSKTFSDMKNLERVHEREAVQKARNLINDDIMEVKTNWRPLIPVDVGGAISVEYGKSSKEKEIQAARQKSVLQSLYLKTMIPDCPSEPDFETHSNTDPVIIPLDDITGNPDTVSDFRNTPWPEPKGTSQNIISTNVSVPPIFPPMSPFPGPFPNPQFNMPGFQPTGPGLLPPPGGEWQNSVPNPSMMVPGGMPPGSMVQGHIPQVLMNPTNMPHGMMIPPPDAMMAPDMFRAPGFPMPPPNMFPPGFPVSMQGGPCPPVQDNNVSFPFSNHSAIRSRGSQNQWRGNRDGVNRGRGGHAKGGWRKAKCIHFMKKGSCRQGDSCPFQHPGVNCPY